MNTNLPITGCVLQSHMNKDMLRLNGTSCQRLPNCMKDKKRVLGETCCPCHMTSQLKCDLGTHVAVPHTGILCDNHLHGYFNTYFRCCRGITQTQNTAIEYLISTCGTDL